MRVAVKLIGFHGCPEVQKDLVDGAVQLVLPDNAPSDDQLRHFAEPYGVVFGSVKLCGPGGMNRISVLSDNETVDDPQTRLASKLRPQSEITVSLLRPFRGGL